MSNAFATRRTRAFLALIGWIALAAKAQTDPDQGLVLVQRTVDARYESNISGLAAVLNSTLTKPYVVKKNDTLQGIVSQHYAVGPSVSPKVFAEVLTRVQTLNGISNAAVIRAGAALSLPDMPAAQWKKPSSDNPNYGIPRGDPGPSYAAVLRSEGLPPASEFPEKLLDSGRKAEPLVSQWRWITIAQAKAEAAISSGARSLQYWSQPLTLKFAQAPTSSAAAIDSDIKLLTELIKKRAPKQDVVVYVLDDSWPSESEFESSRKYFRELLTAVRIANYWGEESLIKALANSTAETDFPQPAGGRQLHAASISSSLANFVRLTPRVKVVYLPLFTQQRWAKEIWLELTYTALVASAMHSSWGVAAPPEEVKKAARTDAERLVAQIPAKIVNSLGPAQQTPITVLQKMAQYYANTSGVPFFISMSWTVERQEIEFGPDPDALGVSLAASGNDRKNVMTDAVYLAYRAKAAPGDILAVMNTDSNGTELCDSNMLPLKSPNSFYGLAYDGRSNDGVDCGSSFSTPRVAWLLALRQAYNAPIAKVNRPDWYGSFRNSVLSLQDLTFSTSRRYWLSVNKLFDGL